MSIDGLRDLKAGLAFLMILTAISKVAYTRKDGIHVVPVDCLGP